MAQRVPCGKLRLCSPWRDLEYCPAEHAAHRGSINGRRESATVLGGFLTGTGVALLGVWVAKQATLIAMDYDLYVLIGVVGLASLLVGAYLRSPLD